MSVHDTNAVCNIVTKLRAMVRLGMKMLPNELLFPFSVLMSSKALVSMAMATKAVV